MFEGGPQFLIVVELLNVDRFARSRASFYGFDFAIEGPQESLRELDGLLGLLCIQIEVGGVIHIGSHWRSPFALMIRPGGMLLHLARPLYQAALSPPDPVRPEGLAAVLGAATPY
ncbi:MAG TPA: hypothetical protein VIG36_14775 [Methylocystis sp.]